MLEGELRHGAAACLALRVAQQLGLHQRVQAVRAEPVDVGVRARPAAPAASFVLALQLVQQLLLLRRHAAPTEISEG